jgi:hypothetical protein
MISVIYKLDGSPHEVIIKDTKYYVKELYSADKRNTNQLQVSFSAESVILVLGPFCGMSC